MELKLLFLFLLSCSCQGSPCGDKDDCVNRVDQELREDYSSVMSCDNPTDWGIPKQGPGLRCGDICYPTYEWCSASFSIEVKGFSKIRISLSFGHLHILGILVRFPKLIIRLPK